MPYQPLSLYDATVPSDGLTVDTPLGPVDLVAVYRRLRGVPGVTLTLAETTYVLAVQAGRQRYGAPLPARRAAAYRRLARDLAEAA